jgi:hypothetical protein
MQKNSMKKWCAQMNVKRALTQCEMCPSSHAYTSYSLQWTILNLEMKSHTDQWLTRGGSTPMTAVLCEEFNYLTDKILTTFQTHSFVADTRLKF